MLSLEYRLAPEHPHPVPVEDAYAGLAWLAGHAAGVAILSRDRKGPAVARQLLIYPMLDDRTTVPDRYIAPFAGWSYDDNATGWNALLGPGHEHREVDPPAAPGRLEDAAGLPAELHLHLHPGVPHEYDAIASSADVSRRAQSDRDRVLRSL